MEFSNHELCDKLSPHIEAIFHFKSFNPDHNIERVVPTGHVFLLFELDGFKRNTFDNKTLKPNAEFSQVWISGMHRNHLAISAHQDSEMCVIQFKPAGTLPFVHKPMHLLNERVRPAEEIFGENIFALRKLILDAANTSAKFKLVEHWLLDRFDPRQAAPDDLLDIIGQLQAAPAGKYQAVIDGYPNSQKHLIDQFKKYVGLTPKYYHRILRFNDLLLRIHAQELINWSDVAYQCGFSDQSHFIKEFQHFSGFNPGEFLQQDLQHESTNFFPLDKG